MREYTIEDFNVGRNNYELHSNGYWHIPLFESESQFDVNYSSILTELIHTAGRYCDLYASDLFVIWKCLTDKFKDRNYTGEKLILGFREMGVDKNEEVIRNYNNIGEYYYRKIHVIKIEVTENCIDMYMN